LQILTTEHLSSQGSRPDLVWINELSHISSQAFAETMMDNCDKCPWAVAIIATNAGEIGTWQEKWMQQARESDRWHYSELNKPAPWINQADLEESRRRNPLHRFNRLWRGVWSSGTGEGIDPADIAACKVLTKPEPWCGHRFYFGGIDLGLKRDRSAVTVLAADSATGTVSVAASISWRPEDFGGEIDLTVVQKSILVLNEAYRVWQWAFDPWQASLLATQLRQLGVTIKERPFVPREKDTLARAILEIFRFRLLRMYPDDELERDLLRLRIREGPVGFRLDAVRDSSGHADKAVSLAIALPEALYIARNGFVDQYAPLPEYVIN
jgi:hypothetical protein